MTPAPSPRHQRVSFRLQRQLADYFGARSPGEVFSAPIDVILSDHDIVQPDLVVVDRPAQVSKRGVEGAPLLVVEILSPSTRKRDRTTKARRYAALGIPHLWLVDPEAHWVECYRAEGSSYRLVDRVEGASPLRSSIWPDLVIDLSVLRRDP